MRGTLCNSDINPRVITSDLGSKDPDSIWFLLDCLVPHAILKINQRRIASIFDWHNPYKVFGKCVSFPCRHKACTAKTWASAESRIDVEEKKETSQVVVFLEGTKVVKFTRSQSHIHC